MSTTRSAKACLDWFLIQIIHVNHFQLLKASYTKLDRGIVIDKLVCGGYSEALEFVDFSHLQIPFVLSGILQVHYTKDNGCLQHWATDS